MRGEKMEIFIILAIILAIFMPYIMCLILTIVIIGIINTKSIKNKKSKILTITIILLCIFIVLINIKDEKPNELYIEMSEINNNQELIDLSKEEVVELLGIPKYEYNEEDCTIFRYNAGNIGKGIYFFNKAIFFDCYDVYVLEVVFNEDNKVKSTSIQYVP